VVGRLDLFVASTYLFQRLGTDPAPFVCCLGARACAGTTRKNLGCQQRHRLRWCLTSSRC